MLLEPAGGGAVLRVDLPLTLRAGDSVVVATPSALRAAAASSSKAALVVTTGSGSGRAQQRTASPRGVLLRVDCSGASGFITARGAASLALLGLSVQGCGGSAVTIHGGGSVTLQVCTRNAGGCHTHTLCRCLCVGHA